MTDEPLPPYPYPTPPPTPLPQYPPYIPESQMDLDSGMPRSTLDGIHDDGGVIIKKPGELGPPPTYGNYVESPPGSGVWVPDKRPHPPGSVLPASTDTYPTTGDPAVDEAIRQTFTNLVEIRDALGTGQTPASGPFYTDAATKARNIQCDIQSVGRAADSHWIGESGDMYRTINQRLA
ncbi:hypothetical protein [Mycobacterium hubeiense]|uniref:hypothetical protein n=1 Tax=Mycobacterium hubeiense TaxID=1867256 RepID=UPI0018EADBD3|nr:hypothetical protein [Mycobacterium sp. QGD 101]